MTVTAKNRQRVHRWLRKWQRRLLLDAWEVSVEFSDQPYFDDERHIYATMRADARYSRMYVTIYVDFWSLPEEAQEKWIQHELGHGPVSALAELAARAVRRKQSIARDVEDAEERLVEWFARVAWRAYE